MSTTILVLASVLLAADPPPKATLVYVASETRGILLYELLTRDLEVSQNITLGPFGVAADTPSPMFFEIDSTSRRLFTVNRTAEGAVTSFAIEASGRLTKLNQQSTHGSMPCHLAIDAAAKKIAVANCGSASLALLPLGADGKIGESSGTVQTGAKTPCAAFDRTGEFLFACGADQVLSFRVADGKLTPAGSAALKPGSSPRRLAFSPDGKFLYTVNEQSSSVTVFAVDGGSLKEVQTISSFPEYAEGPNIAMEVGVYPTGEYLFVSNKGHNNVVLFGIDKAAGTLTFIEEQGTGAEYPIHFGIQPKPDHLGIANYAAGNVLIARIDSGNGRLKPSGVFTSVPAPTCVRFLQPR